MNEGKNGALYASVTRGTGDQSYEITVLVVMHPLNHLLTGLSDGISSWRVWASSV